jgi:mannosylfructose-6-phosphate phosphatase
MKKCLLIADLDETLLGDDASLRRFAEWHRPRAQWLKLVYASGRLHDAMRQVITHCALPLPEAVIAGVGTEIRQFENRQPLAGWTDHFLSGWSAERTRTALARFNQLRLQPDQFQSQFKVSYYARGLRPAHFEWLHSALRAHRVHAELIYSSNRDLDVLPRGANKGAAAAYLVRQGRWPAEQVLVAGDSGNDLALFRQGFRGIVVANAHDELRALSGSRIYHSSLARAAGVLDGVQHWLAQRTTACQLSQC